MNGYKVFQNEVKSTVFGYRRLPRKKKKALKKFYTSCTQSISMSGEAAKWASEQLSQLNEQMKPFYDAMFREFKQNQRDEKIHSTK